MSGRDVIGIAKTGSGKTLGFLLPMFRHVMDQRELDNGEGPIGLGFNFLLVFLIYTPVFLSFVFIYLPEKRTRSKKREFSYNLTYNS